MGGVLETSNENTNPGGQVKVAGHESAEEDEVYHHESDNAPRHSHHDEDVLSEGHAKRYWRANLGLLLKLLVVWAVVSLGFSVLFADYLNRFSLFGYPLGFWWAQQGSIYVFVALIFIYVIRIRHIDRRFGVDDDE